MDFLLDPNFAYLALLAGILLGLLAIITPGTGMLEIGAFFCLMFAGYAAYNLAFNWWALLLLALSLIPFVYASRKPNREVYLAISIFLLVVGSIFLFAVDGWKPAVNPLVAFLASGSLSVFLWVGVRKSVQAAIIPPTHDLETLIGQMGEARTKIQEGGSVFVGGEMWSARSDRAISAGGHVRVVKREGFILVVESENSEKE